MHRTPLALLFLAGCSGPPAPAPPASPPPEAAEPSAATPPEVATPAEVPAATVEPTPEVPPEPPMTELDLLHAVPSRIGVSSAYRDDASQVGRIADGDLETAWNSRTGDLGAWIELAVPAEASVRAIAMTTGFTHVTPRADLFTGNLRIARVRLSRDGAVLGEHDLDTDSRTPIEIPVNGPGGVFRVEVVGTLPGTRSDWQEICVSEVRVLGTALGASAGTRSPTAAIGALSVDAAPMVEMGAVEADEAAEAAEAAEDEEGLARADLEACSSLFLDRWAAYTVRLSPYFEEPDATERQVREREAARRAHREIFDAAAALFADVSPELASRATARSSAPSGLYWGRWEDYETLVLGCDALMAQHPSQACAWAEARSLFRLAEVVDDSSWAALRLESNVERRRNDEGLPIRGEELDAARRELAAATAQNEWFESLHVAEWDELGRARRATLLASDRLGASSPLRADLERAERECGASATTE